jgi:glyoxylase-like metal-dependent hydrolase (beta-lactamase superfamily II)
MKIIPLSEGSFTVDATKKFVPFQQGTDQLNDRTTGSLLVEIQPFAVVTSKDVIVIDAGLGFSNDQGVLQLHENLIREEINPMDVTKVLMSHLHKDHAGGISREDTMLKQRMLSFPNAQYIVNEREFEAACAGTSASYNPSDMLALKHSEQLVLVAGSGYIDQYIHYEHTGAHSPWHQVFKIEEEGQLVFFGGDVAPQLIQMKTRFVAKYDFDGKQAAALRMRWWEQGLKENWTFLFYHDIKTPVYPSNKTNQ